jgi:hypothetical protein
VSSKIQDLRAKLLAHGDSGKVQEKSGIPVTARNMQKREEPEEALESLLEVPDDPILEVMLDLDGMGIGTGFGKLVQGGKF